MSRVSLLALAFIACTSGPESAERPVTEITDAADGSDDVVAHVQTVPPERPGGDAAVDDEPPAIDTAVAEDSDVPEAREEPLSCVITSPAAGAELAGGVAVRFSAAANAVDVVLVWTAPGAGRVIGNDFDLILPAGRHSVTLEGSAPDGRTCADAIAIAVTP